MLRTFHSLFWAVVALISAAATAGPVNINTADAATLAAELQGVGMARAQAIVAHREAKGPFGSPEELLDVSGVGPAILEQNVANIRVDEAGNAD